MAALVPVARRRPGECGGARGGLPLAGLLIASSACAARSGGDQANCGDGIVEPGDICHVRGPHQVFDFPDGGYPFYLIEEVTLDGLGDVLWLAPGVGTYAGRGDGTFEHVASADLGPPHHDSLASEAFVEDGLVHLLLPMMGEEDPQGDPTSELVLFTGDGSGEFERRAGTPINGLYDVAVGDFDGNGRKEVVAWTGDSGELLFVPITGSGFGEPELVIMGEAKCDEWPLRVGDFNGDGASDVLCMAYREGSDLMVTRYGGRISEPQVLAVDGYVDVSAVADMNDDGADDVVALTDLSEEEDELGFTGLWMLHGAVGAGLGTTEPAVTPLPELGWCVAPCDLDLDGVMDFGMMAADRGPLPGTMVLARGDGEGGFHEVERFEGAGTCNTIELNGDGVPDFLLVSMSDSLPDFGAGIGTLLSNP
jgi:hypothetical protein